MGNVVTCYICGRPEGLDALPLSGTGALCSDCFNSRRTPEVYKLMGVYEPALIAQALGLSTDQFKALKYLLRAGRKPGYSKREDLYRAIQAIEHEILMLKWEEEAS